MLPATVPVTLRPITASDEAFLFALYASTREGEVAMWGWAPAQREAFLKMQWLAQGRDWAVRYAGAEHRLVLVEGQPAGRMVVARGGREWRLVDISLLPSSRGAGVGTRLLRELQDEAAKARVPVKLRVLRGSPAYRLYLRLGFRAEAAVPASEGDPYVALEWAPSPRGG
ncbi:GNAT family N-acetyltransferase [Pyxidicoccus fallax]|uniref:GNAT family N-acetyltransferase n=1 Tax=Pyxidicoccus fallax TaxID=394095 RepID=A0A848LKW6_9BACT|nr:GNAT family N-acetyltransferase [Pyxidicoccus fallax]NMO18427.1 GNAT family N-acetyltransferase [Pyxidicoccus fallax]NPC78903.1 GNAT family N-acetyltransferase [Pyxidicoccus fallax]